MDLLTDPYLDELRAMEERLYRAWLSRELYDQFAKHFHPLAATANPELSPDGEAVAVGGSIPSQGVSA